MFSFLAALIRPGRIDRKIEFPLPDEKTKRRIFNIHTSKVRSQESFLVQCTSFTGSTFLFADDPCRRRQRGGVHHGQGRPLGGRHQGHLHRGWSNGAKVFFTYLKGGYCQSVPPNLSYKYIFAPKTSKIWALVIKKEMKGKLLGFPMPKIVLFAPKTKPLGVGMKCGTYLAK